VEADIVNARDKLQAAYEIAFFPPRIHRIWSDMRRNSNRNPEDLIDLLKMALTLHQALPEYGYASHRALKRLAIYQANARLFGTVSFLRNILSYLKEPFHPPATVPPQWVRDIGLPEFGRKRDVRSYPREYFEST
jgi:hypothetical protein